jgi:hypothetical protein
MDLELKLSEMTSPALEHVRPAHTGEEHLLATLTQLHPRILFWISVELMSAHKAVLSSRVVEGKSGDEEGEVVGDEEGEVVGDEEGEEVGDEEGEEVGDEEGEEVGDEEGEEVGNDGGDNS